ncbi:hypothetical protein MNBD_ACTINO02-2192 [hydrothermal vent metagenome]|uniref:Two-component transcriptional response regulator, LuxR family n=1 Tax=hydrothermal vent metagenome TaxID=652676 RepID=A0A3B0RH16_9ZZZZ
MRILLVEDDDQLRGAVERRLRRTGFAVDTATTMSEATEQLNLITYHCLILDRAIPGGDTISLVAGLRRGHDWTPVLFLTAKDAIEDRVDGFEVGGNDYLIKPFAMAELVVRVRNLCRLSEHLAAPTALNVGDLTIDLARAEVRRGGVLLPLSPKEFAVVTVLARQAGQVVSRSALIDECWDDLTDPMSNTVDVHVAALRRKLGKPRLIKTVRGSGYLLDEAP